MDILFKFAFWFLFLFRFIGRPRRGTSPNVQKFFFFFFLKERSEWFSCVLILKCWSSHNGVPLLLGGDRGNELYSPSVLFNIWYSQKFTIQLKTLVPLNPYNCTLYVFIIHSSMTGECVRVCFRRWLATVGMAFYSWLNLLQTVSLHNNCPSNTYAQRSASANRRRRGRNCQWESTRCLLLHH